MHFLKDLRHHFFSEEQNAQLLDQLPLLIITTKETLLSVQKLYTGQEGREISEWTVGGEDGVEEFSP